jgi:tRNA nucleotidyltransferase/poly(A) polymerase
LASGLIRAIGDADKRIEEDKLRMLRGVRFAAKYGFSIENQTLHAIQQRASELSAVSNERIGAEMQRMLTDASRAKALELLRQTNLLPQVLLDKALLAGSEATWEMTLKNLAALRVADFCAAAAILVEPIATSVGVEKIADHWKLSNQQKKAIKFALTNKETLEVATNKPWSVIQPLLLSPFIESTLAVLEAVGEQQAQDNVSFLRKQLAGKSDQLDPLPLITGNDLIANGVQPGPAFKRLLEICRAKQLVEDFARSLGLCQRLVELT